jgi:Cd2+/Zn2+-exporting ATPase
MIPNNMEAAELMRIAAALEAPSEHPFAKAILSAVEGNYPEIADFKTLPGMGVSGIVDGKRCYGGNAKLMNQLGIHVPEFPEWTADGKTPLYFAWEDGTYLGAVAAADVLKPDSAAAVAAMQRLGLDVVMLTGDNAKTASAIAAKAGITHVISDVLPGDKANAVKKLQAEGHKVLMVGDGINDAPVLSRADIGIAMGALGSDAAIEAADVVLMDDDPGKIAKAIRIAKKCLRIVKENIVFAIGVKLICLALGALGIANMWLAIFADVGVMVICVLNAIRCLAVRSL